MHIKFFSFLLIASIFLIPLAISVYVYFHQVSIQKVIKEDFSTSANSQAIANQILTNQLVSRGNNMKDSTLTNVYHGTITEIVVNEQNPYNLVLQLTATNGNTNTFRIPKEEMPVVKTMRLSNEKKVNAALNDLTKGDNVTINEKINMLNPWGKNRLEFTIIKQ